MAKRFALARYNQDGSLDHGFSFGGKVLTDFDIIPEEAITAIAVDSQGRIVVGGRAWGASLENGETRSHFVVARYDTNGSLDHAFNGDGKVITPVGTNHYASISALVVDDADRVIAGGLARSSGRDQFALARYGSDGILDPAFGDNGIVLTHIEGALDDSIEAVELDLHGRILVGGWVMRSTRTQFAVARYLPNGEQDSAFGASGLVFTDFDGSSAHSVEAVAIDGKGRLVAGGWATVDGQTCYALARYTENGALDNTFGQNGTVLARFSAAGDEMMKSLRVDELDRIVVGGLATVEEGTRFALVPLLQRRNGGRHLQSERAGADRLSLLLNGEHPIHRDRPDRPHHRGRRG
ncbi:MAG: hypothetical protein HC802_02410 [Caldilineaceae bacterium]|nr:hypothetical protein [Caldilineaceae bacterium]